MRKCNRVALLLLAEMLISFPMPDMLRCTLVNIYSGNLMNFVVG